MKKYLIVFVLVGSVVIGAQSAKAVSFDDLSAAIASLSQEVSSLKSQILEVTLGSMTAQALPGAQAASSYVFSQNLQTGSQGAAVLNLQNTLIAQGYLPAGSATGYYGNLTAEAVSHFQSANNLPALGVVGSQTNHILNLQSAVIGGGGTISSSNNFQTGTYQAGVGAQSGVIGASGTVSGTGAHTSSGVVPAQSSGSQTGSINIDAQANAAKSQTNSYGSTGTGSATVGTLSATAAPGTFTFTHVLQYGEKGDEVKKFQLWLNTKGYLALDNATGFYGMKTVAGVKALQIANGVPTGDGTAVGPKTQAAIAKGVVMGSVR